MQRGYGEMANRKMYVISGGMIMCDLSNMVCMPVMGNAKQHEVTSIWAYSPVTCMLIENDEGLILFDTGCHPEAMIQPLERRKPSAHPCYPLEKRKVSGLR